MGSMTNLELIMTLNLKYTICLNLKKKKKKKGIYYILLTQYLRCT